MGKNIFKKNMIIILSVALMCAGIIVYSFVRSYNSMNYFFQSGYVHTDPTVSENKKLLFVEGQKYHPSLNDRIKFNDINDQERIIDSKTFIHYDNQSISSFSDGVIVDLEGLNSGSTMSHYHMSANVSIEKQGSSYVAMANGQEITLTDFIWKLGENKYLVISPSIMASLSDEDVRDVGSYAEVTYLGDSIIQIQTEDNIWQTISKNCSLQTSNGSVIDLPMKNIKDSNDNVLLDFNRMVVDSNDNVEVAPLTEEEQALSNNIIPHFTVETQEGDPGLSGTTGTPGLIGSDGNYGVTGLQGNEGDSESVDNTILNFPVFSVKDWNVSATSCTGKISVTDEDGMLQPDNSDPSTGLFGQLYLADLASGSKIFLSPFTSLGPAQFNFKEAAENESTIDFTFSGLKTDHSYMLCVSAPLKPDDETDTYSRMFITKTFWTDSIGVYMEAGEITTDSVSVVINRNGNTSGTVFRLATLYDSYEEAAQVTLSDLNPSDLIAVNNSTHEVVTYTNTSGDDYYKSDSSYYSILAYDLNGDNVLDDYSTQILELKTLKQAASIGSPVLKANRNNWGFDVTPGSIYDPDGGISKYVYEFYDADQFTSSGDLIDNPTISKTITTTSSSQFSIALDGVALKANTSYRVRATAYFNDNVKSYTLVSGFSGEAQLDGATKPKVYFDTGVSSGTTTTSSYYDTITGTLYVSPGTDGAKLFIDRDKRTTTAKVKITDSSSYSRTFDVLPPDEIVGKRKGDYLVGLVNDNGDVSISFNDYETEEYSWVSGLKPDRDYEISITGDLSEDGVNIIEYNTLVGKCNVKTNSLEEFRIYSSYESDNNADPLKNFKLAIPTSTSDRFVRQKAAIYAINISVYPGDQTSVDSLPTAIATKTYTLDDKWTNSAGDEVWMYYDTTMPDYQNGVHVVKKNNQFYRANAYGEQIVTDPISEVSPTGGTTPLTYSAIMSSPSKNIIQLSVIEKLFNNQYTSTVLGDGTTDYIITEGGLMVSIDDFDNSQKSAIMNVSDSGVTVVVNGLYDYTYNSDDWCKNNQQPSPYVNEFTLTGEVKTYIQFSQDIADIVTAYPFEKLIRETNQYVDYSYRLQAQFNNKGFLAEQITYYVFDAVDFYNGSYNRSATSDSEVLTFAYSSTAPASEKSFLEKNPLYSCPVLDNNKILAKITVDMGTSTTAPAVLFYPYTKQDYKNRNGSSGAPDDYQGTKIMYLPDGSTAGTYGHQYVFCWTINYHGYNATDPTNVSRKLVYPFDASVKCKVTSVIGSHTPNIQEVYTFAEFANASISTRTFDIQGAYWNDGSRKYGEGCYMLLPHAEKTSDTGALCDEPIPEPTTYAIQYSSDDNSVTMKTFVVDNYGAVYQSAPNECHPYQLTSGSSVSAIELNTPVKIKKIALPNNPTAINYLIGNTDSSSITITRTQAQASSFSYNSSSGTGYVALLIPIQLYTNKYTNTGTSLHDGDGVMYINGSSDGNWSFNLNTKNTNKYYELLTTQFNKAYDYKSSLTGTYDKYELIPPAGIESASERYIEDPTPVLTEDTQVIEGKQYYDPTSGDLVTPEATDNPKSLGLKEKQYILDTDPIVPGTSYYKKIEVVQLQSDVKMEIKEKLDINGSITSYDVHLYGPAAQIKEATGVRLFVGSNNILKIDKYINPTFCPTEVADLKDFSASYPSLSLANAQVFLDTSGNIHIAFNVDIENDLSARVNEFNNESFAGQSDVPFSACLLYETNSSGLGLLGDFKLTRNDNYFSKTNDVTYSLKRTNTVSRPVSNIKYLSAADDGSITYSTSANTLTRPEQFYRNSAPAANAVSLLKFGGFLQMYGGTSASENRAYIQVRSTRYWNTGLQKTEQQIDPKINPESNGTYYYPVKVVEGGKIMISKHIVGGSTYDSEASQVYLETGGVDISISDYSNEIVRNKATVHFTLHGTSSTDNLYFTVTRGASTTAINEAAEQKAVHLVPDTSTGVIFYKLASDDVVIPANTLSTTSTVDNPDAYLITNNLTKAFNKVNGDISKLDFRGLEYTEPYTVTFWQWKYAGDGADAGYKFVKLQMPNTATVGVVSKIDNYHSFSIGPVEVPTNMEVGWFAEAYDDKGIKFGLDDDVFDTDTMYYVLDLYEDDNFLTHIYASDSEETFYFDADSLNPASDYKMIYNDNVLILHDGDNHITFTPSSPTDYYQDLNYGGTYKLFLRLYEKGTGPAWSASYDYNTDYDNLLKVYLRDEFGNPSTIDNNKTVEVTHEFTINNDYDFSSGTISSTIEINGDSAESYITFIIPDINYSSYSIRHSRFTPVVVREHVEGSTTTYYDVTKDLLSMGPTGMQSYDDVGGIYSFGQSLRLNINKSNDGGVTYTDKYDVGDKITIYIYSRQDDLYDKIILGSANTLANLQVSDLLTSRYTVKPVNSVINTTEYPTLSTENVNNSRLMGQWQRQVTSAQINAGKVTVSPLKLGDNEYLTILLKEASGITSFSKVSYGITIYSTSHSTIGGITTNDPFPWPLQEQTINLVQTQSPTFPIDITNVMSAFSSSIGGTITKLEVTLKFYDNKPTPQAIDITPDPDDASSSVSSDKKTITYTIIYS